MEQQGDLDHYSGVGFGNFRQYMHDKEMKFKDQERELRQLADGTKHPNIFAGLVIHVNGLTQPPHGELRRLIVQRGGAWQHYLHKSAVTHIIASNLTNTKMNEFRTYKVVRPEWIMDSISEGKLLSWSNYRLYSTDASQEQINFSGSLARTKIRTTRLSSGQPSVMDHTRHDFSVSSDVIVSKEDSPIVAEKRSRTHTSRDDIEDATEDDSIVLETPTRPSHNHQTKGIGHKLNERLLANEWNRKNSSLAPDFLDNYYRSSRLHYLSTWKAELKDIMSKLQKPAKAMKGSTHDNQKQGQRTIMHVDFDCFFASVGILSRPHLKNKPVAVCHNQGTGEDRSSSDVASCNYVAREVGVRNGMSVGHARKLCPRLEVIPYEFDKYKKISQTFYQILMNYADELQAVSVDEALLNISSHISVPEQGEEDVIAKLIRDDIREATGCEASIGVGRNILLAKMATRRAKPHGHYVLKEANVQDFLADHKVVELPGVGRSLSRKLEERGMVRLRDVAKVSKQQLQHDFGEKTGMMLYNFCRGIDDRPLEVDKPRQSVSAEVSWGIRFETQEQVEKFVHDLSREVSKRLKSMESKAKSITFKIKKRAKHATEARKHLGHGECDNFSKSAVLDSYTDEIDVIARESLAMLGQFGFEPTEIRGIAIQMQRLDNEAVKSKPAVLLGNQATISFKHTQHSSSSRETGEAIGQQDCHYSKEVLELDEEEFNQFPPDIQDEIKELYDLRLKARETQGREPVVLPASPNYHPNDEKPQTPKRARLEELADRASGSTSHPVLRTTTSPVTSQISLPPWSQLDPAALIDMPDTMRKTVLKSYERKPRGRLGDETPKVSPAGDIYRHLAAAKKVNRKSQAREIDALPSPSQVDLSVLTALPLSIQKEYEDAYRRVLGSPVFSKSPSERSLSKKRARRKTNQTSVDELFILKQSFKDIENTFGEGNAGQIESEKLHVQSDSELRDSNEDLFGDDNWDAEFLAALPADIEEEILRARDWRKTSDLHGYEGDHVDARAQIQHPQQSLIFKPPKPKPSLLGKFDLDDIRDLLTQWITSFPNEPEPSDMTIVNEYMVDLVNDKYLEDAQLVLVHLLNQTEKLGSGWALCTKSIAENVNKAVNKRYGGDFAM